MAEKSIKEMQKELYEWVKPKVKKGIATVKYTYPVWQVTITPYGYDWVRFRKHFFFTENSKKRETERLKKWIEECNKLTEIIRENGNNS